MTGTTRTMSQRGPAWAKRLLLAAGMALTTAAGSFAATGDLFVLNSALGGKITDITPAGAVNAANPINGVLTGANTQSIAFDGNGNLYVADRATNSVKLVTSAGTSTFIGSGLNQPSGLVFDSAGNLYVSNYGASTVAKYTSAGTLIGTITGFNGPIGMAIDTAGNLFVANNAVGTIDEVSTLGVHTQFATTAPGGGGPYDLAFDSHGDLYASINGSNQIQKFTPGGSRTIFASSLMSTPTGIDFDANDDLYVANATGSFVTKITPAGTSSVFAPTVTTSGALDLTFAHPAPEPAALVLFATGLAGLGALRRRGRR